MTLPTAPAAYIDCHEFLRLAADTPGGMRWPLPSWADASKLQQRINNYRVILRTQSRRVYPPSHHMYDQSEFDFLQVQIRGPDAEGTWWVYIRPHGRHDILPQGEPISITEPEVLQIEYHPIQKQSEPELP